MGLGCGRCACVVCGGRLLKLGVLRFCDAKGNRVPIVCWSSVCLFVCLYVLVVRLFVCFVFLFFWFLVLGFGFGSFVCFEKRVKLQSSSGLFCFVFRSFVCFGLFCLFRFDLNINQKMVEWPPIWYRLCPGA